MILWKRLFHNICIDKMKALFPIKKEYVKKIFDGSKAYEYRKSFCSLEVDTIVILKSASNLNGNLNCSKELEHYAS